MKEDKALNIAVGIGVIGGLIGGVVLAVIISALGVFDSYLHSSAALVNMPVPVAHPFREWLDDTGGWAGGILALGGAGFTIYFLVQQNRELRDQNSTFKKQVISHELRELTEELCIFISITNALASLSSLRLQLLSYLTSDEPAGTLHVFCEKTNRVVSTFDSHIRSPDAQLFVSDTFHPERGKFAEIGKYIGQVEGIFGSNAHRFFEAIGNGDPHAARSYFLLKIVAVLRPYFAAHITEVNTSVGIGYRVENLEPTPLLQKIDAQIEEAYVVLEEQVATKRKEITRLRKMLTSDE